MEKDPDLVRKAVWWWAGKGFRGTRSCAPLRFSPGCILRRLLEFRSINGPARLADANVPEATNQRVAIYTWNVVSNTTFIDVTDT